MAAASEDTFQIGLALSGAISAGAYTAGVLDYLFQALNAWEQAKKKDPRAPQHQVNLQVVTGASAGAITGALGAIALARGFRPQPLTADEKNNTYPTATEAMQDIRCVLPSLYETWVIRPRMVAADGGIDFLSSEDLDGTPTDAAAAAAAGKPAPVVSALNARLLDDIKKRALSAAPAGQDTAARPPYPYIADNLHVYMTVSNLRGIPFEVSFGTSTYGMQTHTRTVRITCSRALAAGQARKIAGSMPTAGKILTSGPFPQPDRSYRGSGTGTAHAHSPPRRFRSAWRPVTSTRRFRIFGGAPIRWNTATPSFSQNSRERRYRTALVS